MPASPDIQRHDPRTAADREPRLYLPAMRAAHLLRARLREESGISLLEVLISALLVALISVAILSGLSGANRATAEARAHAQAVLCAQQDEERLRGMSELQLGELTYAPEAAKTLNEKCQEWKSGESGTVFTLTTTATYLTASSGESASCTAAHATADYIRTTSSVTWPALGSRPPVTQSSIVTTPNGASLIGKALNPNNEAVVGATITATGPEVNRVITTGSNGCALFGTLPDAELKVKVEKLGLVGPEGASKQEKAASVAAGTTTPEIEFHLGEPGSAKVSFKSCKVSCSPGEAESGDTFVAAQTNIGKSINYDVGGTPGTYASEVALSGLYPFLSPETPPKTGTVAPYTVYAGECEANNPAVVKPGTLPPSAPVTKGNNSPTAVAVEEPPLTLTAYKGTNAASGAASGASVKITNTGCAGVVPNNYSSAVSTIHRQVTNSSGGLTYPGMPYGNTFGLCVSEKVASTYHIYETTFSIKEPAGTTLAAIYLEASGTGHRTSTTEGC